MMPLFTGAVVSQSIFAGVPSLYLGYRGSRFVGADHPCHRRRPSRVDFPWVSASHDAAFHRRN